MCLAFPAKVEDISEKKVKLDFRGTKLEVKRGFVPVEVGDMVLIHANKIVDKLNKEQYEEYLAGISEL
jgi:hydrogenase maturation factor